MISEAVQIYQHLPDFKVNRVTITSVAMRVLIMQRAGIEIARYPNTIPASSSYTMNYVYAKNVPLYCGIHDSINISKTYELNINMQYFITCYIDMSWSISEQRTEIITI